MPADQLRQNPCSAVNLILPMHIADARSAATDSLSCPNPGMAHAISIEKVVISVRIFFRQIYDACSEALQEHKKDSRDFFLFCETKIFLMQHKIYFIRCKINFMIFFEIIIKKECRSTLEIYMRCLDIHSTILLLAFPSSNIPIVLSRNSLTCDLYFSRSKERRISVNSSMFLARGNGRSLKSK